MTIGWPHLLLFGSTFVVVYALGSQSLYVNNGRYLRAFLNSFLISACNLFLFKLAPEATAGEIAAFMLGGPFGTSPPCGAIAICTANRRETLHDALIGR